MPDSAEALTPVRAAAGPRVAVLGRLTVTGPDNRDLTPRSRKARALAAYVLLAGEPVGRERLKTLLWGDRGEEQAAASLRQSLYELRDLTSGPTPVLAVSRDHVAPGGGEPCDLALIETAAARGDIATLTAALAPDVTLLSGLDGVSPDFDDWLAAERVRLRDRIVSAAVEAAARAHDVGDVRRLADALERVDPLNEPVARMGITADHRAGDLASLHRRYRRFQSRLKDELNAQPAEETRRLFDALTTSAVPEAATADAPAVAQAAPPARRRLWIMLALGLVVVAAIAAAMLLQPKAPATAPSVAVLPFVEVAPRGEDAYFAAGVSEEVRDLLARDAKLRIVGSRSARLFGAEPDPLKAARRLGVNYVVEGEVKPSGDQMAITARLMRVADGKPLWSRRYDRPVEDVFAVQSEIAAAVAQHFSTRLAPRNNPHLVTRPEVYDRYLEARSLARERREPALQEAQRLLQEAVRLDPGYAPAFASLSEVTMLLTDHPTSYGALPFAPARDEARAYAKRALELAPDLGDAYAAYGLLSLSDPDSLPFYERAVALDPQRSDYHRWLAQSFIAVGRQQDALSEYRRAVALEPLWVLSNEHLMSHLLYLGRRDEAQAVADRYARLSNDLRGQRRLRMLLASDREELAAWVGLANQALREAPGDRQARVDLAKGLAILGENARAAAVLPATERAGRAVLTGSGSAMAAEANRLGVTLWDREPGYWDFAGSLFEQGHGPLLLKLYDARFHTPEEFTQLEGLTAADIAPPVIAAMMEAGRTAEAQALAAQMLRRMDRDASQGVPAKTLAYGRAVMLASTGRRAQALDQLEIAGAAGWSYIGSVPYKPLGDRAAFRAMAAEPRLQALQARLAAGVNAQRALLHLAPLPGK